MIDAHIIPPTWVRVPIGEICETINGGTPKRSRKDYFGGKIPWIKSGELNDTIIQESEEFLTEEGLANSSANMLQPGTLLIALYGATVGKLGILGIPASTNQAICGINPKHESIEVMFLFYYLLLMRQKLRSMSFGGAQGNISQGIIRDFQIPLAPEGEQKRIVSKVEELLSRLDAGVKSLSESKVKTEQYRSSLLRSAFRGDLTAAWRKSNRFPSVQHPRTAPKWLPDSWSWLGIGDVTEPSKTRLDPKKRGSRQYLGLKHIESDTSRIIGIGDSKVTKSTKSVFNAGDILYGRLRPYLNKVVVPEFDGVCSTDILVFSKNTQFSSRYLAYVFLFPKFVDFATKRMTGVQHPRIPFSTISKYEFPFPPPREQEVIVEIVERNLSLTRRCKQEIGESIVKSSVFKNSILQQAVQGQLVPQDPSEGHAQEILNRLLSKDKKQVQTRLS